MLDTEKQVKAFQEKYGLKVDGVFGKLSYDKFMEVTKDNGGENIVEPEEEEVIVSEEPKPEQKKSYIVTGGSVYLWNSHPSYGGEKGVIVKKGDELEIPDFGTYVPIVYNGSIKWINGKYISQ